MSLPEFNPTNVALILLAWTLLAVVVGMLISACIREADEAELADDETWLDDAPTEILAQSEIDARFDAITSRQRTWWA